MIFYKLDQNKKNYQKNTTEFSLCLGLLKANRWQLWKGKQNKNSEEKWNNGVNIFTIIKLQKHLVIKKCQVLGACVTYVTTVFIIFY